MTELAQPGLTPPELDQLQRLRATVIAFQNIIAALPADEQDNGRNEQFNQLRLEAQALLKEQGFDKRVARAMTEDVLAERAQKVILPRLSAIVILGVILALLGLGINSIILDEFVINSLACLISSGGMFLIIGAFGVWGLVNTRRRLSNLGDLYVRSTTLLHEIDHALTMAIPVLANRPLVDIPPTPSVVELVLDSLHKQAADWQQKLRTLEEQRLRLGLDSPQELGITVDFAQRELDRVRRELDRWQGRTEASAAVAPIAAPVTGERRAPTNAKIILPTGIEVTRVEEETVSGSQAMQRAKSVTMDMPALKPDQEEIPFQAASALRAGEIVTSQDEDSDRDR